MALIINRVKTPALSKDRRNGQAQKRIEVLVRRSKPTVSEVHDTYWRFADERQRIYFRRLERVNKPWTADPILQAHRFTNAYRAADRVSQYLIRNVIYTSGKTYSAEDIFFRIILFKIFNRISTWELLEASLGTIRWSDYCYESYDRILATAIDSGRRIYSAAYIMPACCALAAGRKHRGHLRLIEKMVHGGLVGQLGRSSCMAIAFEHLASYPMMGNFLAYQYIIDLNYSTLTDFSEDEFVVPGPGARDGLRKVFTDPGEYNEADLIRYMADQQELQFDRLGLEFRSLWGRRLQLIDCQNLFCEVDKYSRVYHPTIAGVSGRSRIKQRFCPDDFVPSPWFPPKWKLNNVIAERHREASTTNLAAGLFASHA